MNEELLNRFEQIVILKSIIFDVDLNYLSLNDLDKIINYANDMEIDLNCKNYERLDYAREKELSDVYEEWKGDVCYMFDDIRERLLSGDDV